MAPSGSTASGATEAHSPFRTEASARARMPRSFRGLRKPKAGPPACSRLNVCESRRWERRLAAGFGVWTFLMLVDLVAGPSSHTFILSRENILASSCCPPQIAEVCDEEALTAHSDRLTSEISNLKFEISAGEALIADADRFESRSRGLPFRSPCPAHGSHRRLSISRESLRIITQWPSR